jgi:hypothetical protein
MNVTYIVAFILPVSLGGACAAQQSPSNVGGDGIDRAAATIALESIDGGACNEVAGPRGKVHVAVMFAPAGNVVDAQFEPGKGDTATGIAGTPRGDCLLARLRELHVPVFKGAPTKVGRQLVLD